MPLLLDLIISAQEKNETAMLDLIKRFDPLIKKYSRKVNYDEDFVSSLILHLIETILVFPIHKMKIETDYAIINYISKSLYFYYIGFSKKRQIIINHENYFEQQYLEEWLGEDYGAVDSLDEILLFNMLQKLLSKREYQCVLLITIEGMSSTEAAKKLGISRQSANENKLRGLKKLKQYYESNYGKK